MKLTDEGKSMLEGFGLILLIVILVVGLWIIGIPQLD